MSHRRKHGNRRRPDHGQACHKLRNMTVEKIFLKWLAQTAGIVPIGPGPAARGTISDGGSQWF